jgi:transcriptional regulator with XRE-family HTH domain
MKKYETLGDLLLDYRKVYGVSQADLAASINVDTRTIQRWENGSTLINVEKENDVIGATQLPYQLLRNLNTNKPIPTFYDFDIRKYSLTQISNDLPDLSWFEELFGTYSEKIRTLDFEKDREYLLKHMHLHKNIPKNLYAVIQESARIVPELNLIIKDNSGYISGHSMMFPLKAETQKKLKERTLLEENLTIQDLANSNLNEIAHFHNFHITADCNDSIFYMINEFYHFFQKLNSDAYLYTASPIRRDTYKLNDQLGLKLIWEEEPKKDIHGINMAKRFYEGTFTFK